MELDADDLTLMLAGLSGLLPDNLKLAEMQGEELDAETLSRIHALGDSARELLIRATRTQHNHVWHCLVSGLDSDATQAEQAMTAYANEVADERPDEMDALVAQVGPPLPDAEPDEELPGVTIGLNGVTAPPCGTIIDT